MLGRRVSRESAAWVLRCCSVVAWAIPPPPLALATSLLAADEIGAPDHLGYCDFRRLEVDASYFDHNIEDRCRWRAGAVSLSFDRIPAPGRMLVLMVWIGAADMA